MGPGYRVYFTFRHQSVVLLLYSAGSENAGGNVVMKETFTPFDPNDISKHPKTS